MLGAAFFAYADEYLLDVKFGSPKVGETFSAGAAPRNRP
jgi:hypothetical protein